MDNYFSSDVCIVLLLITLAGILLTPVQARDTSALPRVDDACNAACRWWMSLGQKPSEQTVTKNTGYQAIVPNNFNELPKKTIEIKEKDPDLASPRSEQSTKNVVEVLPPKQISFSGDTYFCGSSLHGSVPILSSSFQN